MNCLCRPKVVVGKEFGFMEETQKGRHELVKQLLYVKRGLRIGNLNRDQDKCFFRTLTPKYKKTKEEHFHGTELL